MACVLTIGMSEECDDSLGGIKAGQFLVGQLDTIDGAATVTAGEITALTQVADTDFYRYWMKKETANTVTTVTKDPLTGTTVAESVTTAILQKMTAAKNVEFKLVAGKPLVLIYQDQNDLWWCVGITNGSELLSMVAQTGQTLNEQNGYTLTFTTREGHLPYTVDATVVAGLSIA
jgi:hypothetical protein